MPSPLTSELASSSQGSPLPSELHLVTCGSRDSNYYNTRPTGVRMRFCEPVFSAGHGVSSRGVFADLTSPFVSPVYLLLLAGRGE